MFFFKCAISVFIVRLIAQSIERQTPDILLVWLDVSTCIHAYLQSARVQNASALDILEPSDEDGLRSGQRPQPVEVSERDGPKFSLLNSADYSEYPHRKVGGRTRATSSVYCGLCPRQSFH